MAECKRSITQTLNSLLSEKGTDPSVLLCILEVVKGWIEDDFSKPGTSASSTTFLSPKEIVSFLQKLSQVDKENFPPSALEEWDKNYLQLLYGICAESHKYVLFLCFFLHFAFVRMQIILLFDFQISSGSTSRGVSEGGTAVHAWFTSKGS